MAVNVSSSFYFLGPNLHDSVVSGSNISLRKDAGTIATKVALQAPGTRNRGEGGISLEFNGNHESLEKNRVQDLVDKLHVCAKKGLLKEAQVIHGHVFKSGFSDDNLLVLLNHVMHAYLKCSDFKSSDKVFYSLPMKNIFSWSVMILGMNQREIFRKGLNYFCEMMEHGTLPDGFAYSAILQSCIGAECVKTGLVVHAQIIVRGFDSHVFVSTTLLNMYAKLGNIEEALRVFNSMEEPNEVSWNALISGFTTNGFHLEAFDCFVRMKEEGFVPNMLTFVSVLKAVGMLGAIDKGKRVHECLAELGMQDNIKVGTALIDMYAKCGDLVSARSVFDASFADCGLSAPWNAMISGYSLRNSSQVALKLYVIMCEHDMRSDVYTYCSLFDAIANSKCLRFLRQVHGRVLKSGKGFINLSVENAIADAYAKCGSLEEVKKIFDAVEHRDVISWTTLVSGHTQCSNWEEALAVFSRMREEGFTPNHFTLASVLTACAQLCYLEYGRQIHGLVCKLGFETVRFIESSLIDMYAKGGSIEEAEKAFGTVTDPDTVTLTSIISGYAYHGSASDALTHFKRMQEMRIKPTGVTLLCVLSACSHAGLVSEGLGYFHSMEKDYGLVPKMEHYVCVVDLLGRAGQLNEAYKFIQNMPIEPDEMVWQALLAACRVHGNVEIGEIAAREIVSLCPEYSSTYVLLSNMYMETGSFRNRVDPRKVMRVKNVRKEPGYSWICVKGVVHKFYSGDTNHPQKDDIYIKLEEIRRVMKGMGYAPDLKYASLGRD